MIIVVIALAILALLFIYCVFNHYYGNKKEIESDSKDIHISVDSAPSAENTAGGKIVEMQRIQDDTHLPDKTPYKKEGEVSYICLIQT